MRILILGGNRFSGKLIVTQLYKLGHKITIMNRSGTGPVPCTILKGDRNNAATLNELFAKKRFDCVIDMCLYNLEQAKKSLPIFQKNADKYIFISSVAVYRKNNLFPIKEISPTGPWPMFENYGVEKQEVEQYITSLKNFPYIILRPTYIIGKNNHHNREGYYFDKVLNNELVDLDGDGSAVVSFVFAEDLASIVIKLATSDSRTRQLYNICNDEYVTIKGFVEMISSIVNKPVVFKNESPQAPFKNEHCFFSNKKIKKHTNYKFKTLKQGLTELYEHSYKIS